MTTTTENQTAKTKQVPDFYICAQQELAAVTPVVFDAHMPSGF